MQKEFRKHPLFYSFLILILLAGFFVRVYRIDQILGFYFDQGRDALVIWDLIHKGKMFLIGPTTGIAGIFRGPWYYWLITPFYFIGRGDPVYPSVFLSFTTVLACFLSYKIGEKIQGKAAGIIAAIIGSFSFYFVYAARWLSNPTPMFLISVGVIYSIFLILEKKDWAWVLLGFLMGMSMQFGSATEFFYFPALAFIMVWKKLWPKPKYLLMAVAAFAVTLAPQVLFDFKHGGILRNNIFKFIFGEETFKATFWETVKIRLPFYFDVFASKIFPQTARYKDIFAVLFGMILLIKGKQFLKNDKFVIVFIFLLAPMVGMLFFQGNEGNVYDYYFTGYYLIFTIVLSVVWGSVWKSVPGKIFVILFLYLFLKDNIPTVKNYIVSGVDGPNTVAFGNQKQAIDWVYKDAAGRDFNVDEYVPPVIPYAYNYLFNWYGLEKYNRQPIEQNIPLLYTLYEVDPSHPERLEAWMNRQKGIAKVTKEQRFGGIIVQERLRIPSKK